VNGLTEGVTAIAAGEAHTCAVVNGGVTCWGSDHDGQFLLDEGFVCGKKCDAECDHAYDAEATDYDVSECSSCTGACHRAGILVPIEGLSNGVTAIAAGNVHTCALFNGGVQCWGDNASGQLGDGSHASRHTPRPVAGLPSGVEAVTAGADHSCALANGGVYCWGSNLSKQLGAERVRESLTPIQVNGLTHGVTAITAGNYHTCAIVSGTVQCWGANDDGQLGNDDRNSTYVTVEGLPRP
jgi:alpha-tubulin suppressor-like RCC1 family protein